MRKWSLASLLYYSRLFIRKKRINIINITFRLLVHENSERGGSAHASTCTQVSVCLPPLPLSLISPPAPRSLQSARHSCNLCAQTCLKWAILFQKKNASENVTWDSRQVWEDKKGRRVPVGRENARGLRYCVRESVRIYSRKLEKFCASSWGVNSKIARAGRDSEYWKSGFSGDNTPFEHLEHFYRTDNTFRLFNFVSCKTSS